MRFSPRRGSQHLSTTIMRGVLRDTMHSGGNQMRAMGWLYLAGALTLVGCKAPVSSDHTNEPTTTIRQQIPRNDSYATGNERRRDQRRGGARSAAPGQFDYYLLTLSWSPEFCYSHPDKPECRSGAHFLVHGMWPENNDGSYPEDCSDAPGPSNPAQYNDLYPDQGLLQHEWQTHGTCSGMSAEAYFNTMRHVGQSVKIPEPLADVSSRISLTPDQIITGFVQANRGTSAGNYTVGCSNNFLTQVQLCVDKNMHPLICQGVHSCGANVVRITPPGTSRIDSARSYGGDHGSARHRHRSRRDDN
jgi:ribonuclease T2